MLMNELLLMPLWLLLLGVCACVLRRVCVCDRVRERESARDWGMQRITHGKGSRQNTTTINRGRGIEGIAFF
jgi:hypothetical protein